MSQTLLEHQKQALPRLSNGKVLVGDVGSGKSFTAAMYYAEKESPKDVYVITTAKKRDSRDWEIDFSHVGVGVSADATTKGILTVDSWNNISKYLHIKDAFFIFDEQRLVGAGAWVTSFVNIVKRNNWIMLSATPGDTWLDYIPLFVANGFYKNRTAFKREHVVYNTFTKFPKVDRYIGTSKLARHRQDILVEMDFVRKTKRNLEWLRVGHDRELVDEVTKNRWDVYLQKPLKDIAALFRVVRKITNSDPSRLDAIKDILQQHDKLIVFYNFDYELEILRTLADEQENICFTTENSPPSLLESTTSATRSESRPNSSRPLDSTSTSSGRSGGPSSRPAPSSSKDMSSSGSSPSSGFAIAEWNGHKHEPIPKTDKWVYLVQYVAGAEGWNCIETNAMAFYSLTYSYKNWHQAMGRIDRLNTEFEQLYYYVLVSTSWIDLAVKRALLSKKSFNESRFWKARK